MKKKSMMLAAFFAAGVLAGAPAYAEELPAKPAAETGTLTEEPAVAEAAATDAAAQPPTEEAVPTETEEAVPEEAVPAETGEAPATDDSAVSDAPVADAANPMLEYPDIPSLERAVGFPVYYLPGNLLALYHPAAHIYSIDRYVSDIRFQSKADDSTITVRTALIERIGTDDISGYHGEWTKQSAGDVKRTQVYVARTESGMHVIRWSAGRFAFAVTLQGIDDETFRHMLKNFVSVADRFAHKYRNFRLNIKKPQPATTDASAATEAPAPADASAAAETPAVTDASAAPAGNETAAEATAEAGAAAETPAPAEENATPTA